MVGRWYYFSILVNVSGFNMWIFGGCSALRSLSFIKGEAPLLRHPTPVPDVALGSPLAAMYCLQLGNGEKCGLLGFSWTPQVRGHICMIWKVKAYNIKLFVYVYIYICIYDSIYITYVTCIYIILILFFYIPMNIVARWILWSFEDKKSSDQMPNNCTEPCRHLVRGVHSKIADTFQHSHREQQILFKPPLATLRLLSNVA